MTVIRVNIKTCKCSLWPLPDCLSVLIYELSYLRAKNRLHELMQIDREFTAEDRLEINPSNSMSINQGRNSTLCFTCISVDQIFLVL